MSCAYSWSGQAVVKTFTGFVSGREFIESAEQVGADPRFDTLRMIYNDFRSIDGHSIDRRAYRRVEVCRMGAALTNPNYRVAFVVADRDTERLSQAILGSNTATPYHPFLCPSLESGRDWFDLQPPLDEPRDRHSTGPAR